MKYFFILFLTISFFGSIFGFLGDVRAASSSTEKCVSGTVEVAGICVPSESGLSKTSLVDIITALMFWLLTIFGALAIIAFVIAGIMYLTAAGDENQIDKAKRVMIYAVIGVVVALIGLTIVFAVTNWLDGSTAF